MSVESGVPILFNKMVPGDSKIQPLRVVLYVMAFPRPAGPCILHKLSTAPVSPYGPAQCANIRDTAPNIPKNVQAEYTANKTLWATTNQKKLFVLLIVHG